MNIQMFIAIAMNIQGLLRSKIHPIVVFGARRLTCDPFEVSNIIPIVLSACIWMLPKYSQIALFACTERDMGRRTRRYPSLETRFLRRVAD